MNLIRRDLKPGEHVIIHRGGETYTGRLVHRSRRYFTLVEHRIGAGGALHEMRSERMLVPVADSVVEVGRP